MYNRERGGKVFSIICMYNGERGGKVFSICVYI